MQFESLSFHTYCLRQTNIMQDNNLFLWLRTLLVTDTYVLSMLLTIRYKLQFKYAKDIAIYANAYYPFIVMILRSFCTSFCEFNNFLETFSIRKYQIKLDYMQKIKPNLGCLDLLVLGNPCKAFLRDSCQIKVL